MLIGDRTLQTFYLTSSGLRPRHYFTAAANHHCWQGEAESAIAALYGCSHLPVQEETANFAGYT
jgi:hypothetical protein